MASEGVAGTDPVHERPATYANEPKAQRALPIRERLAEFNGAIALTDLRPVETPGQLPRRHAEQELVEEHVLTVDGFRAGRLAAGGLDESDRVAREVVTCVSVPIRKRLNEPRAYVADARFVWE